MMPFYTIPEPFIWEQTIKKSRFIVSFARVATVKEAKTAITTISKSHHKARHNVYAYRLTGAVVHEQCSDDGEPTGTAGRPVLDVLTKNGLQNTVAVVTRYFGGIKLGAGGLLRAYTDTVAEGIAAAPQVYCQEQQRIRIACSYAQYDTVVYWLNQAELPILSTDYGTAVTITTAALAHQSAAVCDALRARFHQQLTVTLGDCAVVDCPIPAKNA